MESSPLQRTAAAGPPRHRTTTLATVFVAAATAAVALLTVARAAAAAPSAQIAVPTPGATAQLPSAASSSLRGPLAHLPSLTRHAPSSRDGRTLGRGSSPSSGVALSSSATASPGWRSGPHWPLWLLALAVPLAAAALPVLAHALRLRGPPRPLLLPLPPVPAVALATTTAVRAPPPTAGPVIAGPGTELPPSAKPTGTALVLFTGFGDLRLHDHPGLAAAASGRNFAPVFVFDRDVLQEMSRRQIALLRSCVADLDGHLRDAYGVPLLVRVGNTAQEVMAVAQRAGVTDIYIPEDPSFAAVQILRAVRRAAADTPGLDVHGWATPLRPQFAVLDTDIYREYSGKALSTPTIEEVRQVTQPPPPPQNIGSGELLSLEKLIALAEERLGPEVVALRTRLEGQRYFGAAPVGGERQALFLLSDCVGAGSFAFARQHLRLDPRGGLEQRSMARLLQTKKQWWQFAEDVSVNWGLLCPGEITTRAFTELVAFGCLSPRRILAVLVRGTPDDTKERLTDFVEWREWHRLLACRDVLVDPLRPDHSAMQYRYWRHNGFLVRYAVGGLDTNGPAVVLVHGFGASADQWHKQFAALARDHKVYSVDLLGFGHAEKPALSYTQYLWEDQVKLFGMEVVREPYFIAGNSIGGYISLSAAAGSGRDMVRGVVLINSAGRMISAEDYEKEVAQYRGTVKDRMCQIGEEGEAECVEIASFTPLPNWLLAAGGTALFSYLQPSIPRLCREVYPTNPDMVDERLTRNISRDSLDPGALCVITSGAKLPPPRTKNELFEEFGGPVLVTQGLKDPLGGDSAVTRFELYGKVLPPQRLRRVALDAGHCPMHEAPEEVNREIRAWIQETLAPFA
eukprot:EG_transcript_2378